MLSRRDLLELGLAGALSTRCASPTHIDPAEIRHRKLGRTAHELYKTTQHFDGTAQHPEWLG